MNGGRVNDPDTAELQRTMKRNHSETTGLIAKLETQLAVAVQGWSAQLRDYVLREVWETERDAQREQIREIKAEVQAARARAANAIWAAAGSVVGSLALIALKGGH